MEGLNEKLFQKNTARPQTSVLSLISSLFTQKEISSEESNEPEFNFQTEAPCLDKNEKNTPQRHICTKAGK